MPDLELIFSAMNSSDSEESNPFNFKPLKRRKKHLLKSQKVKRVRTSNPITSQKPTFVQKTLNFRTEIEKPVDQQQLKIEGILVNILVCCSETLLCDIPVCPVCQVPLDLLKDLVSPSVHIADCRGKRSSLSGIRSDLMVSLSLLDESLELESCPDGEDCASRDLLHYAHYDHTELGRQRLVTL